MKEREKKEKEEKELHDRTEDFAEGDIERTGSYPKTQKTQGKKYLTRKAARKELPKRKRYQNEEKEERIIYKAKRKRN
jgi:hypothetical protein